MTTERERFEEWISLPPFEHMCDRFPDGMNYAGQYRHYETQLAWEAWQAARAWLPIEDAPDDGASVLLLLKEKESLDEFFVRDAESWAGLPFVGRRPYPRSHDFDMGWNFAAPVGEGGIPDAWLAGWQPLPPPPEGE